MTEASVVKGITLGFRIYLNPRRSYHSTAADGPRPSTIRGIFSPCSYVTSCALVVDSVMMRIMRIGILWWPEASYRGDAS